MRILAALVLIIPLAAHAGEYQWPVLSVLDGDSLHVDLPGLPAELNPMTVRIRGIDAPEAGSKANCTFEADLAIRATELLEALLRGGNPVFSDIGREKYGRILATVTVNGQDVGQALIAAHLARAYEGGKRLSWCD